jgi:inosine-uridine nucleoside N-ribohydrolase
MGKIFRLASLLPLFLNARPQLNLIRIIRLRRAARLEKRADGQNENKCGPHVGHHAIAPPDFNNKPNTTAHHTYGCVSRSSAGPVIPLPSTPGRMSSWCMSRSGCQAPPHPLRTARLKKTMTAKNARQFRLGVTATEVIRLKSYPRTTAPGILDFRVPICESQRINSRMRRLRVLLVIFCLATEAQATTVWIDTDVSIGSPIREVDDAFALVLAFHSPEIQIAGLTTTYGNASLGHTTRAARDLVEKFGRPAGLTADDVFAGARAASDFGRRSEASDALAGALEKQKITYLALGPLTNLATMLRLHPKLAHRIERIIFVGGAEPGASLALGPNGSFRIHDTNVFKDPAAARAVLESKIPLTLVPIATSSRLLVDGRDLRQLAKSGDAGNYLSRRSRIWLWFWMNFVGTKGGPIFDALAIIPATEPGLLSIEERSAQMDQAGNLLVRPRLTSGARSVRYCTGFALGTKRFVMRRLMTRRSRE